MSYTGNEGSTITGTQATAQSSAWASAYAGQPAYYDYACTAIGSILAQSGCVGVRTYFAINGSLLASQVAVGTDANENDQTAGSILCEGSSIGLDAAGELTAAWRDAYEGTTQGVFIGGNNISTIIGQSGAASLRIHFGIDTGGVNTIWMEAVNSSGATLPNGVRYNFGSICPTRCGTSNKLNS